jgi:hypothetical protein
MKINKIKIQVFTLLVLLLTSIGCDDEKFLTEEPKTFYTTDNIFSSETQLDQVLITMYSALRGLSQNAQILGFGTDIFDAPEFRSSTSFTDYSRINAESGQFSTIYNFYYQTIKNANTVLDPDILEGVTFESEDSKAYIIAQARFFRAYCH